MGVGTKKRKKYIPTWMKDRKNLTVLVATLALTVQAVLAVFDVEITPEKQKDLVLAFNALLAFLVAARIVKDGPVRRRKRSTRRKPPEPPHYG